jgi:hypothetical protein
MYKTVRKTIMKKILYAVPVLALLAGCAPGKQLAVMQHPKTKDVVQCKVGEDDIFSNDPLGHCIRAYEKAGYKRIDEHAE